MVVGLECKWNKSEYAQSARGQAAFQTTVSENVTLLVE